MRAATKARIAGLFCLLMCAFGGVATSARRGLIVHGNASATATNILAHENAFRLAFAGDVLVVVTYLVFIALFYELIKPVNRSVARVATFLSLVGCAIQAGACVFELAPLVVLKSAYPSKFKTEQLQELAIMFLNLYTPAYGVALVFFAFYCVLLGYLVYKSTFLPRTLGVLVSIAGLSWLSFLYPPFATKYFPYIFATAAGEGLLYLWLLVMGVNEEKLEGN